MVDRDFKSGQIYRYGASASALCRLRSPHSGTGYDWLGENMDGASVYLIAGDLVAATREEVAEFVEAHRRRKGSAK